MKNDIILSNTEAIIYLALSNKVAISIHEVSEKTGYGFKTVEEVLETLVKLDVVVKRVMDRGKCKAVYNKK